MKADHVIGCDVCGKPALLVGDAHPDQSVLFCFWCLVRERPGAAKMFLDDETSRRRRALLAELHEIKRTIDRALDELEGRTDGKEKETTKDEEGKAT